MITRKRMWKLIDELECKVADRNAEINELKLEIEASNARAVNASMQFESMEKTYTDIINKFKDESEAQRKEIESLNRTCNILDGMCKEYQLTIASLNGETAL